MLEFPLMDGLGEVFEPGLGAYTAAGDAVGCWFDDRYHLKAQADSSLGCRIIRLPEEFAARGGAGSPPNCSANTYVEITNFQGLTPGQSIRVIVGKVKNPKASSGTDGAKRKEFRVGALSFNFDK